MGHASPRGVIGTLKRLVENQEQKVTVALVDTLAEHEMLENLLEDSKPDPRVDAAFQKRLRQLDYLLQTPWRYPPLKWGSRFGRRFEPSLFYGALSDRALFAEAAYYRLLFLEGMQAPFADRVISQFTVFEASYQTDFGMDLSKPPFLKHAAVLRHKADYLPCQLLGTELRERGIEAIVYLSARAAGDELNVALLSPLALRSRKHRNPRHGLCEIRPDAVSFRLGDELHVLKREAFLFEGRLPVPA
ncbi:MAG: RES family NAD+ phosphorylase [Gammaproteobacteria bacterium]|nr:RES family NAD+ phosphorylase [Gammaproteobacteria bacterium]